MISFWHISHGCGVIEKQPSWTRKKCPKSPDWGRKSSTAVRWEVAGSSSRKLEWLIFCPYKSDFQLFAKKSGLTKVLNIQWEGPMKFCSGAKLIFLAQSQFKNTLHWSVLWSRTSKYSHDHFSTSHQKSKMGFEYYTLWLVFPLFLVLEEIPWLGLHKLHKDVPTSIFIILDYSRLVSTFEMVFWPQNENPKLSWHHTW